MSAPRTTADLVRTLLRIDREGLTGTLGVRAEGVSTYIYVRRGKPVFAVGGTVGETLGRMLADDGEITEEQYAEAIRVMTETLVDDEQMRLGEVLVKMGLLELDNVQEALRRQVRRKIMRCLGWDALALSFAEANVLPKEIGHFPARLEPLLFEGVKRWYDRERSVQMLRPLNDIFLCLRKEPHAVGNRYAVEPAEMNLLNVMDGSRTTGELLHMFDGTLIDPFPLMTILVLASAVKATRESVQRDDTTTDAPRRRATTSNRMRAEQRRLDPKQVRRMRRTGRGARSTTANINVPTDIIAEPEPKSNPPIAPAPTSGQKRREAQLTAEQAFQRGLRFFRNDQLRDAEKEFKEANEALPDLLEYRLYAEWTSYRLSTADALLSYMRDDLQNLAVALMRQDRDHAMPPYVLAHIAFADGDEDRARKLFDLAVQRDRLNKDAERHLRLLASRNK